MPITCQLKPDKKLVIFVHLGVVTDDEFMSFYRAAFEDTRFDKSFNLLVDLRKAESAVRSAAALDEIAEFMLGQYGNKTARPKVAVVAPKDLSFGLARMVEVFCGEASWEFMVFRAFGAALAWLGASEDPTNDPD